MSRGLTEEPGQEKAGPSLQEMDEGIEELFSLVSMIYAKVETLEKIIGHSLTLPEQEAVDRKRIKGL